jgi:hypothetical protein
MRWAAGPHQYKAGVKRSDQAQAAGVTRSLALKSGDEVEVPSSPDASKQIADHRESAEIPLPITSIYNQTGKNRRSPEAMSQFCVDMHEQYHAITYPCLPHGGSKPLWLFIVGLAMTRFLAGASTFILIGSFNWLVIKGNSPDLLEAIIPPLCLILFPVCLIVDIRIFRPRVRIAAKLTEAILGLLVLAATIASCIWFLIRQG